MYVWEICKLCGNEIETNAFIEVYVVYLSSMDIWQLVCIIRVGRMSSLLHDRRLNYANEDVLSGSSLLTTLFLCRWPCLPCFILYLSLRLPFAILSYLVYLFNSLNVAKDTLGRALTIYRFNFYLNIFFRHFVWSSRTINIHEWNTRIKLCNRDSAFLELIKLTIPAN